MMYVPLFIGVRMNRKQIIVTFCVTALIAGALFTLGRPASGTKAQVNKQQEVPMQYALPEHVAYEFLFRRADLFRQSAIRAGKPLTLDSSLQREAGLSDDQIRVLGDIAATCLGEVAELDQKAQVIITQLRSRFPGRVVPRGEPLSPPAELEAMQQQRDATILRGRLRLQQALGEQEFSRFDRFMQQRYGAK
jgi:hypothetical protein